METSNQGHELTLEQRLIESENRNLQRAYEGVSNRGSSIRDINSRKRRNDTSVSNNMKDVVTSSVERIAVVEKDSESDGAQDDDSEEEGEEGSLKRLNKNAPAVMRSDKPVKRLRLDSNLTVHSKARDPRFSEISGKLSQKKFMESYSFLSSYQEKEAKIIADRLKKTEDEEVRVELKEKLLRANQDIKERARTAALQKRLAEVKSDEKAKVSKGKKPYFLKESAKKEIALEERYEELKREGKLSKFLSKKGKKDASKDKRWLPYER